MRGLALATEPSWSQLMVQNWCGHSGFACAFRRPLFSVMQDIFKEVTRLDGWSGSSRTCALDDVMAFTYLIPLAGTNLRVRVHEQISCSDASTAGGGSAVASRLLPCCSSETRRLVSDVQYAVREEESIRPSTSSFPYCASCRSSSTCLAFECPAGCGARCCCISCVCAHRETDCRLKSVELLCFVEVGCLTEFSLSAAVAHQVVSVATPLASSSSSHLGSPSGLRRVEMELDRSSIAWNFGASMNRRPTPTRAWSR